MAVDADASGQRLSAREAPIARSRLSRGHIPGEPGVWVLIFGDITVFTVLFIVYLQRRRENTELFTQSQDVLNRTLGAVNTLVLLCSSVLIVFALQALRSPMRRPLALPLTIAGIVIGSCFVVIKAFEYREKVAADITPTTNEFFMYYYVLTGLHLAHVIVGLIVLLVLAVIARKPEPSRSHIAFFEGAGCFWHMVDLLWIVIFPLLFLVR
ncbi:cytochrome c oxidase subunit 3 [Mycolicibacterium pulveris]|uniref:Probable cytochrome c oxidase subunit 3 n=1 Tax=Mycolicibacterium pulveris TaxID=36813 RepID=A0A7I7USX4_MYCPV|nr:cytochrome c oxidase subunit 3 [Mycolicibacterium pulveris]MCV6983826.1 cytochrome c oxidase subunit 3 [Mycolicibacterium pulveris]BBY83709.1 cytochrome c oxidase subunit III [Mycolicibacterium pulveris]